MNSMTHSVIIFSSLHDVMAAEKAVLSQDILCELIPTPGELSSNCGMALEVQEEDLLLVLDEISAKEICYLQVHQETESGYRPIHPEEL
jgi:Putative Se/S carrier protein-like